MLLLYRLIPTPKAGTQPTAIVVRIVAVCVIHSINDVIHNMYSINPIIIHIMRNVAITAKISFVDFICLLLRI